MLCSGLSGYRMRFTTGICGVEHTGLRAERCLSGHHDRPFKGDRRLALQSFYSVGPSVTQMVKWPISGLRISEFKKLLKRMCLYIDVMIEGLLERKLYPSNSSSYQVQCMYPSGAVPSHLCNNIGVVHPWY
jgi:hypothetical protein